MATPDPRKHVPRFQDPGDYARLRALLDAHPDWTCVPVAEPYADTGLLERWYRHVPTAQRWRLVEPDPPFRGHWAPVAG